MGKRKAVLPATIRIGFHDYDVAYVDGLSVNDREVMGVIYENAKTIAVSTCHAEQDIPLSATAQTLIHEILHAIDFMTEYKVFKGKEGAIDAFAEYLCMVIRDNPQLVKLIQ